MEVPFQVPTVESILADWDEARTRCRLSVGADDPGRLGPMLARIVARYGLPEDEVVAIIQGRGRLAPGDAMPGVERERLWGEHYRQIRAEWTRLSPPDRPEDPVAPPGQVGHRPP